MYTCVIVDDEQHCIDALKEYVKSVPGLEVVDTYTDPMKALIGILKGRTLDLIFMDVDMPVLDGLELSKQVRHKCKKLIFTTGHSKYGYSAFEVKADDYLLKPYSLSRFISAVSAIFASSLPAQQPQVVNESFFVKDSQNQLKLVNIRFDDIIAVESKLNYILIHTMKKNVLTYMSLTEFSKVLGDRPAFLQFQRSYIISKNHIEHINGQKIRMVNGTEITVGSYYRKHFAEFIGNNLLKGR